jgi:cytochrome c-type biogenesis protein CcmH/NrfF
MKKLSWVRALLWSLVLFTTVIPSSWASETEEEIERRAQEIIRTTMSPFCPGRTLDSCPSPSAADWRDDVRKWVLEGVPTQEIRERLTRRVPELDLTGAPSTALDAVLPILVSVMAVLLLALLLRRLLVRRSSPETGEAAGAKRVELDGKIDEELARLDE